MASLAVVDLDKKKVGSVDVPEGVLDSALRRDILQAVVRWQLACRRSGTHATRTKGMVAGGGKKPFKQKGTGNARQGSSRSPLMPGGGTMFGPQPRDYSYTLPKEVRKAGLRVALSYLNEQGRFYVVSDLKSDGKTKSLNKSLVKLGLEKAVIIDDQANSMLKRAAKNLKNFKFVADGGVNVFDLLKYDGCVISKESMAKLAQRLGAENGN
ncbi:MAG: 50S ribosomal protein L4 [Oligoflexia bacterium]|nr:50S ribosomal protein L4 [Oligoflexia bacterium]